MRDRVIEILEKDDGSEQVLIVQRPDGRFSYRRRWLTGVRADHSDKPPPGCEGAHKDPLDEAGPYAGIYDSADSAKREAQNRVAWLDPPTVH